jgi:hypothetical protein
VSNVIEIFPGLKEIETSRFRQKNFRPGLIDFKAIDPSSEKKFENDNEKIALNIEIEQFNVENVTSSNGEQDLFNSIDLYDRNGKLYVYSSLKRHIVTC